MNSVSVKPTSVLGREALRVHFRNRKKIEVDDWGGPILVRQLSHAEVMSIQETAKSLRQGGVSGEVATRFTFDLIRFSWIQEDGSPVLDEDDYQEWKDQPNAVVDHIIKELVAYNQMDEDAPKKAERAFLASQNGASGTS